MCQVIHYKDKHKYPQDQQVYIGRPSKWGNPFTHKHLLNTIAQVRVNTREDAIEAYRKWITEQEGRYLLPHLKELKGKILVCWCKPEACHGDILAELINKLS